MSFAVESSTVRDVDDGRSGATPVINTEEAGVEVCEPADVVIGVPTFRRPQWLERCLYALAALKIDRPTRVVVADNDTERREGMAVCERLIQEGYPLPLTIVAAEPRGISFTRNALIAEALRSETTQFIVMIDDDEWPDQTWLSELLRVQATWSADVVGGPVRRTFESKVPDHVATANQPEYRNIPTGPIDLVDATSNILFNAALFRARPAPWFDPEYALMGGEDKDLLMSFKLAGKVFAWASDAVVTEEMPASRCSAQWMIKRAFWVGSTDMMINLKHRPPGFTPVTETMKIIGALGVAAVNLTLFVWHPALRFKGARLGARVAGKIVALSGGRHQEYKVVHGR
jgi:succinoglycan biosynthesis protein ExoM